MNWEQYEVWSTADNHDELVGATKSLKQARQMAKNALHNGAEYVIIYREIDDGELEIVEELPP